MTLAHAIAYFSFPVIALGVECLVISRQRKVRGLPLSNVVGIVGVFALFAPLMLIFAFAKVTEANVLAADVMFMASGIALLWLVRFMKTASTGRAVGILGIALAMLGTYNVSGDFLRDRIEISGAVTGKYILRGYQGSMDYHVVINGRSFPTTLELYDRIDPESRVKARLGQASGTIFEVRKL